MKQLGNLAAAVANKQNCLLQIYDGKAIVHTGSGNERKTLYCDVWDDERISGIVEYINFGTNEPAKFS